MDNKSKQKVLGKLAHTAGDTAQSAILQEVRKISAVLENETKYDEISAQLELLDTIAFRASDKAIAIWNSLLERLVSVPFEHREIPGYTLEQLKRHQNAANIAIKIIEGLIRIRYHQPEEILDILFHLAADTDSEVAKQAKRGIQELAEYDLDIFFGDGKDWPGLAWKPQEIVLKKISGLSDDQRRQYFSVIAMACGKMLAPTIEGTTSDYQTMIMKYGAIPAIEGVKKVRNEALRVLQSLYSLARDIEEKKMVICALQAATETPRMTSYSDDVLAMVMADTTSVLNFLKGILPTENLQIRQSIERDAFFLFRRGQSDEAKSAALEIRDALAQDEEYQIFKVLIGYEGVFSEWSEGNTKRDEFDHEKEVREQRTEQFATSITPENYNVWRTRIVDYAAIKSNDMATFPYFGRFLEKFGRNSPQLALRLLIEDAIRVEGFLVAIFHGISMTDQAMELNKLFLMWCEEGKFLFSLARYFEFVSNPDKELLGKVLKKAEDNQNFPAVAQVISSVSAQFEAGNKALVKEFFVRAVEYLTKHNNSSWIFGLWFRKSRGEILAALTKEEHQILLNNLLPLHKLDYHAEEILEKIAENSPELVVQFFCERLSKKREKDDPLMFEAYPFKFQGLAKPLSSDPGNTLKMLLDAFDGNYGVFAYRGGRFLKNIFSAFPQAFEAELINIVQSKSEKNLLFVMAILRNYEGRTTIHNVCKELIKVLQDGSDLLRAVEHILQSTGVVSGEYGFAEAYARKIEEIKPWLQDKDERIVAFAKGYISNLESLVDREKLRAEEGILLRKQQFGEGNQE
jgi:hypothetical protein